MKAQVYIITALVLGLGACTSIKLSIPEQFSSQATRMPVKGLKGWSARKPLSFGNYQTSKIKRGWNTTTTKRERNSGITKEERILKAFKIENENFTSNQKTKYQYTIKDGNLAADVYCIEKMVREQVEVKTNVRWLGDFSQNKNYQYSFSAVIMPMTVQNDEPWQVVFYNNYDRKKDTARRILDLPYVEESGYASNGKDTIIIKPVRVKNFTTKSGKDVRYPVKILTGYELRMDDGVIAVIDTFEHSIWVYNDLDAPTKLIIASVSSALLLRQVQDVKG